MKADLFLLCIFFFLSESCYEGHSGLTDMILLCYRHLLPLAPLISLIMSLRNRSYICCHPYFSILLWRDVELEQWACDQICILKY